MRILVVENSPSAPIGLFGTWLEAEGHSLTTVAKDALPATAEDHDLVVVLGSPAGAYEDKPWIHAQRDFLARAIAKAQPVVGICFGAQIIAEATGGKAAPLGARHAGWMPIEEAADPVFAGPWPRWHGDHITPPPEAEILARSRGTVQVFQVGSAVGVQFHPEADAEALDRWAAATPTWIAENGVTAEGLAAQSATLVPDRAAARDALFRELLRRATSHPAQENAA